MKLYYDLHIHSALSPCADNDMTPNNIINMAKIKGLNVISITDHNSTLNLKEFSEVAKHLGILFIPGVEIETCEEVHVLLYFKDFSVVEEFQEIIEENLPNVVLREDIYGNQFLVDKEDNIVGSYKKLLLQPLNLSISQVYEISKFYNMIFVPAHINRQSYGIIGRLGTLPDELKDVSILEVSKVNEFEFSKFLPKDSRYIFLHSSDAHHLWDINEKEFFIESDILYTIFFK
ncbi:PHP C-terminal domain protein [Caldicellulosiruptor saccharolyticus DSM 8903]|uniref:PHP C-terminal domain protein n=1 Tax=Caldicellulosiruptor saccharolyticus (strain ATCC 43494 / DSM 8903 / Tp8T 6331) TaxID=351627 RepID=A4XKK9_CALS8|nr:PHP domain-containing protein [Caldicellulosiruptor saccharolyticus]ABP67444.1 PHP C-terminal domain protein [Caldicellulosiruptor saccharolyticus DSM 8903]